jgi:surfeit locus 1 family protein
VNDYLPPTTNRFKSPRFWLLTAAAVLVFSTTFSLGQWQLRRAAQKVALQTAVQTQEQLPTLANAGLPLGKDMAGVLHRKATLEGTWVQGQTLFLDNRPMSEKVGFWVITPLKLAGSDQVLLVQRGWVPRDFTNRARLPEIATPTGLVSVTGRIAPPPSKLYEFKGIETGPIRQNVDVNVLRLASGLPLLDAALLQTQGQAGDGLLREWAAPNLGVERHYGYAFQWFSLAALVLGLYIWFQLINPLRLNRLQRRLKLQRSDPTNV